MTGAMPELGIRDFHAHIYFDPHEVEAARALGRAVANRFGVAQGYFHLDPVGPHPRGSCQLTLAVEQFGEVGAWLSVNRGNLTIFAHANTGDDLADHSAHVIWFGESEALNLAIFRPLR